MLVNIFSNYGNWESDMVGHSMVGQTDTLSVADLSQFAIAIWDQECPKHPFPVDTKFELTSDQDRIKQIVDELELSVFVADNFGCVLLVEPNASETMFVGFSII